MSRNTYTTLFLIFLQAVLLFHFGDLNGISSVQRAAAPDHATFFAMLLPVLIVVIVWFGYVRHLQVLFKFRTGIALLLLGTVLVSLGRDDAASQLRNSFNIILSYLVIFSFCAMAFAIDFKRSLDAIILFTVFIFLPATTYTHLTKVGPLVLFPDRTTDNMLRFGGMVYYAHTAMILGVAGLFSLLQFLKSSSMRQRLWYAGLFLICNVFLVYTDCRSAWGGVGLSYGLLAWPHMSLRAKYIAGASAVLLIPAFLLTKSLLTKTVATNYNTESDFQFRMRIWQYAIRGIENRPVTGYGSKGFLEFDENKNIKNWPTNSASKT